MQKKNLILTDIAITFTVLAEMLFFAFEFFLLTKQ